MSVRFGPQPIVGAVLLGVSGLGILGKNIPSNGVDGAGVLYQEITLPDDNEKEVRLELLTIPSAGELTLYEHGGFDFKRAPDGQYRFTYKVYKDGVTDDVVKAVILNIGV